MKKMNLAEWASLAEIIASIGVVVSIAFLTYTIDQSNKITRATNDNLIYALQDSLYSDLIDNPKLVATQLKLINQEDLTPLERLRYDYHLWRFMNMWEVAYDRYTEGLLSEKKWRAWNKSFEIEIMRNPYGLPKEVWEGSRETYGEGFRGHIDATYARQ